MKVIDILDEKIVVEHIVKLGKILPSNKIYKTGGFIYRIYLSDGSNITLEADTYQILEENRNKIVEIIEEG